MTNTSTDDGHAPYCVAIVAMGPSHADYLKECIAGQGRHSVADETWAINAMAGSIQHDRAIIMDDLPYFAKAARENPSLRGYAAWLHKHPGPIYTQRAYAEFPGSVEYPLADVLNSVGYSYMNSTPAYAICLAIHLKVKTLKLYGLDYTYGNDNRGYAEAGRACVEYWLAIACTRGMKVVIADSSTLCDQAMKRRLYGYSVPPVITQQDGKFMVEQKLSG